MRSIAAAVLVLAGAFALPRAADAAVICVHGPGSACPTGQIDKQADLQGALNLARISLGNDRIVIEDKGSPYVGPFSYETDDPGEDVSIEAKGETRPVLTSTGTQPVIGMRFGAIEDVDVVAPETAAVAIALDTGILKTVSVSGGSEDSTGVSTSGDVTLVEAYIDTPARIALLSKGNLRVFNSSVRGGETGALVNGDASFVGSRVEAPLRSLFAISGSSARLERSLVATTNSESLGIGLQKANLDLDHVTVASRAQDPTADSAGIIETGTSSHKVRLNAVALSGYGIGLTRISADGTLPRFEITNSAWDDTNDVLSSFELIKRDNFHEDPGLVDAVRGDFRLHGSSGAIDRDPEPGVPPYSDIDGQGAIDGDGDGTPLADAGAFEYRRKPPRIESAGVPGEVAAGASIDVAATAVDPDGDRVDLTWDFGDGATAAGLNASHAYADGGTRTVTLEARDERGLTDTRTFTVEVTGAPDVGDGPDSTAPDTAIKGPKRLRSRKAKFTFTATEPGARFECRFDRKAFSPCASPLKLKRLKARKHLLVVRAIDSAGNADQTPASLAFKVRRRRR